MSQGKRNINDGFGAAGISGKEVKHDHPQNNAEEDTPSGKSMKNLWN